MRLTQIRKKTTLARSIEQDTSAVRLCSDEWMSDLSIDSYDPAARAAVDALQQHMAIRLAKAGRCAIYESGGWTRAERDELLLRTRTVQGLISLQYLDLPVDKLWQRVQLRNAQLPYATALRDGPTRRRETSAHLSCTRRAEL